MINGTKSSGSRSKKPFFSKERGCCTSSLIFYSLQLIAVLIPASLILYYALHAGGLPDNDYWGEMARIISESDGRFSRNIMDWIQRNNEHYTLLPKLVYAANLELTGGNNVGLSLFSWFMALLQVPLLYLLIPVKNKQSPVLFTVMLLIIAVFIFSPRQAHNWLLGMSGTAWITANFFVISALVSLQYYVMRGKRIYFYLIFVFSLCAVVTYSTSLALFPVLVIATFFYPTHRRDQLLISLFSLCILGLYFLTFSTPENHPAIQQSLLVLATYIFSFLGALFTLQLDYALISGGFGLVSSLLMAFFIYRNKSYWGSIIPWVSIQLYVCANAAMAALARSGFGLEQVFSSRYGSLPALFWLSWIMLAITLCLQLTHYRKLAWLIVLCLSSMIIVGTYRVGLQVAAPLLERAEQKAFSLASIYSRAIDIELLNATGLPTLSYQKMQLVTNRLADVKHIPFNGLFKNCPDIGSKITGVGQATTEQIVGMLDGVELRNDQIIKVRGWAYVKGSEPECIAISNQDDIVRGVASYGLERLDVAQAISGVTAVNTGWQGYGKVYKHDKIIKVYMLTAKGYWLLLKGSYLIQHQPLSFQKLVS